MAGSARSLPEKNLEEVADPPGWGLICDLLGTSPEIEEACPGWGGLEFPNTLVELRGYVAMALESFRDVTLWGGINEIGEGYFRIDTRRERMRNDLRLQYANAILRNANLWLHHQRISDNRRPIFSSQVEKSIKADKRLDELTQWLIGVTAAAKPPGGRLKQKKKRGAKLRYDSKKDQKVADAWKNGKGQYSDFYELARAFGMTHKEVKDAIGRVRYHKRKRRKNRAE